MTEGLRPEYELGSDRTIEQMLVRKLRELIVDGELQPGAPLRYRDLARRFAVSVTPVRIALRDLAKEGIVDFRPHGGARVVSLSLEEIEEVYAMRVGIESWLARLGAERLSDEDLELMAGRRAELEDAAARGDRQCFLGSAWAYRCVCYRAAGRERLYEHAIMIQARTARYNKLALFPQARLDHSLGYTRDFGAACERRDGPRAQQAIRDLLDNSLKHLVDHLPELIEQTNGS